MPTISKFPPLAPFIHGSQLPAREGGTVKIVDRMKTRLSAENKEALPSTNSHNQTMIQPELRAELLKKENTQPKQTRLVILFPIWN